MVVLTIVLGLGIGVFLLCFGELLVRDLLDQEDVIIYMKSSSRTYRKNLHSRECTRPGRRDEAVTDTSRSHRAA
jgi:hypothetical protein